LLDQILVTKYSTKQKSQEKFEMRFKTLAVAVTLSAIASPAAFCAEDWTIDTTHSAAQFKVRHMMVSNVNGTITGVKGKITFDGDVKGLKVEADLDPKTINTNEPDRDKHLRNADFFDVEKYPTMTFKSKRVEATTDGRYKLIGDLTLHGVTKEVALDMDAPSPILKDPKGKERIGTSATTRINRKDFGMEWNKQLDQGGLALGEQIDVTLDVEANRMPEKKAQVQ
jgi:polyisoprenoid-binding protein YceI